MLMDQLGNRELKELIVPITEFHPIPRWEDRNGWSDSNEETKRIWIEAAEKYQDFQWPTITADHYLSYHKTGDNNPYLMKFYERRSALGILAIAECLEGKGRFLEQIINGVICICEETTWMTPFDSSLRSVILPTPEDVIVDLSCVETGGLLAWTSYLLKDNLDKITPRVCERINKEITRRLILPYMERDDYWWMGFVETNRVNNWNPWCNRHMIACFMILDMDQETRIAGIEKAMRSLDQYMLKYPQDGCCDEGPMYWGAAGGGLHTCLKLLKTATAGEIDIFQEPIVKKIGQYIYKVHIDGNYFVDFADGDAVVGINPGIYNYGLDIGDEKMMGLGANSRSRKPNVFSWFNILDYIINLLSEKDRAASTAKIPYVRDAWMDQTHVMTAREKEGTPEGFFLAAKGGNNGESHNHNDIGNFIVYVDGKPLFIDLGTEEYKAQTFGKNRFDLWYLQSRYHNCPTIGGILQEEGKAYQANNAVCTISDSCAELAMDIAGAYPEEAGIEAWNRAVRLVRDESAFIEIIDDYKLAGVTSDVYYTLMTPCEPVISMPGEIKIEYIQGKTAKLQYDDAALSASIERIELVDSRLKRNWGDVMYRIVLTETAAVMEGVRRLMITR